MDILIHIPDENVPKRQDILDVTLHFIDGHVSSCTYPFEEFESDKHCMCKEDFKDTKLTD